MGSANFEVEGGRLCSGLKGLVRVNLLIEVDATIGEFAEGSLLFKF